MLTRIDLGDGVGAAFTGRAGGASAEPYTSLNLGGAVGDDAAAVQENRRRAGAALGLDPSRLVWMRQVHGAGVAYVDGPFTDGPPAGGPGPGPGAGPVAAGPPGVDAVLTAERGLALAVLVADCAPVLLADPDAKIIGAAHSGRPGTLAGVVPALVERMREHGADPARIVAVIGPAVCGACYEVPAAMRDEVAAVVPEAYATTRDGTPGLDIRRGVTAQLSAAGVADIRVDARCTMETPDLFSFRRDGRTGRFAGFIWLRP
ncbi:peptidoglycan editing factor PgeF [Actinomadura scrupuli]|uniref:peptidoglycan editing factor PgeF n=1 Tax=Actinomadura scrupuli TaxID=559629 RepID=UPI003D9564F9